MDVFRHTIQLSEDSWYYQPSPGPADLPTGPIDTVFNGLFRQSAVLSVHRHPIAV
nr:hypothetical protein [uncultured bacterium]